jgi:hypothetical protein
MQGALCQAVLGQKLIPEMEQSPCSPDFALNDFWLFLKIKSALKGQRFQDTKDIPPPPKKKSGRGTESHSNNVSNSGSIVGLSA